MLFLIGGSALVLTPGIMLACQDTGLRQEMCERVHNLCLGLSLQTQKLIKSGSKSVAAGAGHIVKFTGDSNTTTTSGRNRTDTPTSTSDMASNVSMVDQAVSLLSAQIAKEPNNPSLHNRLGLIYASVGELQRAESQFNQAIDMSRQRLADLNARINTKREKGEIAEASRIMLDANTMELELSSAHSNLARVFEKLGQQSKVVAQLDQLNKDVVIGEGPSSAPAVAPLPILQHSGNQAVSVNNEKKVSSELVANLAKAQALIQSGRNDEATAQLRAVLTIDPSLAEAHEQLGMIDLAAGRVASAIDELVKARDLTPNKASIHAALGVGYQYKGKLNEAIVEFRRALAISGRDASTNFNLGNAYAALGKNDDAASCYQKAVNINPNMAVAHNNLGSLYSIKSKYEAAIKEFEEALTLAPTMYSAHYGLGLALYRTQDYAAASREFKAALALNPNLVDAHHKIALCDRQCGATAKHQYQDVALR